MENNDSQQHIFIVDFQDWPWNKDQLVNLPLETKRSHTFPLWFLWWPPLVFISSHCDRVNKSSNQCLSAITFTFTFTVTYTYTCTYIYIHIYICTYVRMYVLTTYVHTDRLADRQIDRITETKMSVHTDTLTYTYMLTCTHAHTHTCIRKYMYRTLDYIASRCTAPQYHTLPNITLHYATLPYTNLHYRTLTYISLHYLTLPW